MKKRKFYRSALTGKFVSRAQTKRMPSRTITQRASVKRRR